jgi:hypothetical protein
VSARQGKEEGLTAGDSVRNMENSRRKIQGGKFAKHNLSGLKGIIHKPKRQDARVELEG